MNTAEFRSLTADEIDFVAGGGFYFSMPVTFPSGYTHAVAKTTGTGQASAEAAAVPYTVSISIAQAAGYAPGDTAFASATAQA